ncbi:fucolectin-like [Argopecten irradians]|uniref:fucolectin-like n=1 Tax=Argopecten irradians TaxID=31199 RepID=UPI003712B829
MAKSNMGLRKITFTIILLCVVRSFVAEKNVAVGKPSQQSSKYNDVWVAKNVVDGCVNTSIGSGCCTHTNTEDSSGVLAKTVWWRVNLEQMTTINRITIYYRGEHSLIKDHKLFRLPSLEKFQTRLAGYELYVSNSTSSPQDGTLCFTDTSSTSSSVQLIVTHQCPYVGQYVTVYNYRNSNKRQPWYSNDAVLILCEVQVWVSITSMNTYAVSTIKRSA